MIHFDEISGPTIDKVKDDIVAKILKQFFHSRKNVNKIYSDNNDINGIEFIDKVIEKFKLIYEFNAEDLKRIPANGPFITISNHPFGGLDGLLLIKLLSEVRPDYKVFANYLLHHIDPIKGFSIPLNEKENNRHGLPSTLGFENALNHLQEGKSLGIFPAGEFSTYRFNSRNISDKKWQNPILRFMKNCQVPIIPIYFQGNNSWFYHFLGSIHPVFETVRIPSNLLKKDRKKIKIKIGTPILAKDQDSLPDINMFGRFLRTKTYALGTALEVKKFFRPHFLARETKVEKIIDPVPLEKIVVEINNAIEKNLLFKSGNFVVLCAPAISIPNILNEIGRLREITFREVGEGTNRALDLDEFDLYFHHLIIWDEEAQRIVGAYRAGKGNEILSQYGKRGFYIQSLFNIKKEFYPILNESIELGRSFVIKEYQRKPLSLFLLWKGILYFLLKNQQYRYLLGPASISNDLSQLSKSLIVNFFETNYYNKELSRFIKPRKRFIVRKQHNIDGDSILKNTSNDLNKLDKFIQEIDSNYRIPILLKKYISLNAKLLGFNIDPKFNNCVDGLVILDIFDIPIQAIKSLSKEINDDSILERFHY